MNTIIQMNEIDLRNLLKEIIKENEASKKVEEHYTLNEALTITGKTRSTLWAWEKRRYLTPVRMGKTLLYLKSDLDGIMNTKRKEA